MSQEFDDSLDDLLGGAIVARPRPTPPESYKPLDFSEACKKCNGRGRFISYAGRDCGPCFACKGAGKKTYKAPAEARERARNSASANKARKIAEKFEAFRAENPEVLAWIQAESTKVKPFEFAVKMSAALADYGDLTDGQLEACKRGDERAKQWAVTRAEEQARRAAEAPIVDGAGVERLKESFDHAAKYAAEKGLKLKKPKIVIGGIMIHAAEAHSANPGALYVKTHARPRVWLGTIKGGKFFPTRDCSAEVQAKILAFVADPSAEAKAYGQTTGTCCVCNATLISKWKHLGIGPICAQKFGW